MKELAYKTILCGLAAFYCGCSDSTVADPGADAYGRRCGNHVCEPWRGETCTSCPVDCGACAPVIDAAVPDAPVTRTVTIGEPNVLGIDDYDNGNLLLAQQASLGQTATLR